MNVQLHVIFFTSWVRPTLSILMLPASSVVLSQIRYKNISHNNHSQTMTVITFSLVLLISDVFTSYHFRMKLMYRNVWRTSEKDKECPFFSKLTIRTFLSNYIVALQNFVLTIWSIHTYFFFFLIYRYFYLFKKNCRQISISFLEFQSILGH